MHACRTCTHVRISMYANLDVGLCIHAHTHTVVMKLNNEGRGIDYNWDNVVIPNRNLTISAAIDQGEVDTRPLNFRVAFEATVSIIPKICPFENQEYCIAIRTYMLANVQYAGKELASTPLVTQTSTFLFPCALESRLARQSCTLYSTLST